MTGSTFATDDGTPNSLLEILPAIVEQLPDAVVVAEAPSGRVIASNARMDKVWGSHFPLAQSLEDYPHAYGARHPDGRLYGAHEYPLARAVTGGEHVVDERLLIERKDGSLAVLAVNASPIRDAQGVIVAAVVTLRDVTERQLLERLAEARSLELEATIDSMADGVIIYDAQGAKIRENRASRLLFGSYESPHTDHLPIEERGRRLNLRDAEDNPLSPEDIPAVRALNGETLTGENAVDLRFTSFDGREAEINCTATPLRQDGSVVGAVCVYRDVTARRALERQRDDFLSAAAHDLKTPLTAIKGMAQLASRRLRRADLPDPGPLAEPLTQIDATATRMTHLIDELLDVTRTRADRPMEGERRPGDLLGLIRQVVDERRQSTHRHRIELQTEEPELQGEWDFDGLERVLTNLISNAIKYSPDGGEIVVHVAVELENEQPCVSLSVTDSGLGIPAADLPHIFDRFYRASNVESAIPGTGVGLAGVKRILERHGGSIDVTSEQGIGTAFTLRLPA